MLYFTLFALYLLDRPQICLEHLWGPLQLSGFVSTYHPMVLGSNPKHTIYAFSTCNQIVYIICHCVDKKNENKQKEAVFGSYKKDVCNQPIIPNNHPVLLTGKDRPRQIFKFVFAFTAQNGQLWGFRFSGFALDSQNVGKWFLKLRDGIIFSSRTRKRDLSIN